MKTITDLGQATLYGGRADYTIYQVLVNWAPVSNCDVYFIAGMESGGLAKAYADVPHQAVERLIEDTATDQEFYDQLYEYLVANCAHLEVKLP